jgi:hypothetical protein
VVIAERRAAAAACGIATMCGCDCATPGRIRRCRSTLNTGIATFSDYQQFDISAPAHAISIPLSAGTFVDDRRARAAIRSW